MFDTISEKLLGSMTAVSLAVAGWAGRLEVKATTTKQRLEDHMAVDDKFHAEIKTDLKDMRSEMNEKLDRLLGARLK